MLQKMAVERTIDTAGLVLLVRDASHCLSASHFLCGTRGIGLAWCQQPEAHLILCVANEQAHAASDPGEAMNAGRNVNWNVLI